jgi:transcriptional regulator with XRE-family HTH domain
MSQSALAAELGITFQQVQKYEKGTNRVGSSRLQHIARVLGTTPSALFGEDVNGQAEASHTTDTVDKLIGSADGIALNKAYLKIKDANVRKAIIALVKSLAPEQGD